MHIQAPEFAGRYIDDHGELESSACLTRTSAAIVAVGTGCSWLFRELQGVLAAGRHHVDGCQLEQTFIPTALSIVTVE